MKIKKYNKIKKALEWIINHEKDNKKKAILEEYINKLNPEIKENNDGKKDKIFSWLKNDDQPNPILEYDYATVSKEGPVYFICKVPKGHNMTEFIKDDNDIHLKLNIGDKFKIDSVHNIMNDCAENDDNLKLILMDFIWYAANNDIAVMPDQLKDIILSSKEFKNKYVEGSITFDEYISVLARLRSSLMKMELDNHRKDDE